MNLIKILLSYIFLADSVSVNNQMDSEGWVKLDREKIESQSPIGVEMEQDYSVWVVFAKQLGPEQLLLRFPADPHYEYQGKSLLVQCEHEGISYQLKITEQAGETLDIFLKKRLQEIDTSLQNISEAETEEGQKIIDLEYLKNGQWIAERILSTPHYTYILQTKAEKVERAFHQQFISSFDLEKTN